MNNFYRLSLLFFILVFFLPACGKSRLPAPEKPQKPVPAKKGTFKEYSIGSKKYRPLTDSRGFTQRGIASWYGRKFHNRPTANGESYNMYAMTAAHKILPMNTKVKVINEENGKSIVVRINDRGPFVKSRIIDLSYAAAKKLGVVGPGTARVRISAIGNCPQNIRGTFYIQVGSFTVKPNALYLRGKLLERGFQGSRITKAKINGKKFWRVQAGVFKSLSSAQQAQAKLETRHPKAFIIAD